MRSTATEPPPKPGRVLTPEEDALRHVAMLVARGAPRREIFAAVAEQVARILGRPWGGVMRYDAADSFVVLATWGEHPFQVGSRWPLDGPSIFEAVLRTGRPAAVSDYKGLSGTVARAALKAGIVGAVGAPIVVDGATWGLIAVPTTRSAPIPEGAQKRLIVFAELVATAISNAEARHALAVLADEQAELRRVAMLVARESSPVEVFAAVTQEAHRVLESEAVGLLRFEPDQTATLLAQSDTPWDPPPLGTRFTLDGENVITQVFRTGRAARWDDWAGASGAVAAMASVLGVRSAVATPVVVDGNLWGTIIAATSQNEPLPAEMESRIAQFTGLVATAIANAEARGELSRLAEEQAALRRIAVLVAQQPSPHEVFTAVTEAVGLLLGADVAAMHVFRGDGVATVVASWSQTDPTLAIGTRLPLDGDSAVARIFQTASAARIDGYADVEGGTAEVARGLRLRSSVGAPIVVQGKLWGALMAGARGDEPLPEDAEARIAAFTELVATAVSNAQAREDLQRLADEQAALRRVATLVAGGTAPREVFGAVAAEVGVLFGADIAAIVSFEDDGTVTVLGDEGGPHESGKRVSLDEGYVVDRVRETSRSARFDTDDPSAADMPSLVRALGIRSSVASPVLVQGELWGAITAASVAGSLPSSAQRRLTEFTALVATAVANTQARERVSALAEEQAALRRVATLVAEDAPPPELFRAATVEVGTLLEADFSGMARFEDGDVVPVAVWAAQGEHPPVPERWPVKPGDLATTVGETRRAVRWDGGAGLSTPIEGLTRDRLGVRSSVAMPILAGGRLWGVLAVHSRQPLPQDSESRMQQFGDLVATAIANADARANVTRLADQQAALRRVATLVAAEAPHGDVFAAIADGMSGILGEELRLVRFEGDRAMVVASSGGPHMHVLPVGSRISLGGNNALSRVFRTAEPARIDDYQQASGPIAEAVRQMGLRGAVATPVIVEGRRWGAMLVGTFGAEPVPPGTERRLGQFTELMATAIANAEARAEIERLAEEQAALRRVATLVAEGVPAPDLFASVTQEVARVVEAPMVCLIRYEPERVASVVASVGDDYFPVGTRWPLDGPSATAKAFETGRPARVDDYRGLAGAIAAEKRKAGITSTLAVPITVDGRAWGAVRLATTEPEPLPTGMDARLSNFTGLVATAISNASSRSELIASRARIVSAGDEARRRIERNLHDGTQQRLIALGLNLQSARATLPADQRDARSALERAEEDLEAILVDLREVSHGLHPPLLSRLGLGPSLHALARRSPIPVHMDIDLPERPIASLETAVYYVVSEAVTNAIKHSHASEISVTVTIGDAGGHLHATIVDDGRGGADPSGGSGLTGLLDRVDALGGRFALDSPPRGGTTISVEFPVEPTVTA